jgi:hypothetical protein
MAGLRRSADAYFEVVDDKAVIVDPAGTELLTLNKVGTVVWHALDGERDEAAIVDELAARFPDVSRDTLSADVRRFLAELEDVKLVERRA